MVGKRRPHKNRPVYKKVVGTGEITGAEQSSEEDEDAVKQTDTVESIDSPPSVDSISQAPIGKQLPPELIDLICFYCPKKTHLLLINRLWFIMALPHVYAYPKLTPANFSLFVEVITKHRELGSMVRDLDLLKIAQVGKNSMVSRLLRRCSPKLERFIAPQSHFGYAPMISLNSCENLRILDLSLVSETLDLPHLFSTIQKFHDLEILLFPRSSIKCEDDAVIQWPPNLRHLGLSGGFPSRFLETTEFPPSLTDLYVSNCPYMTTESLNSLLDRLGHQLKRFGLTYPVPHLNQNALDSVLLQCPNLLSLQVSIDYVSSAALDTELIAPGHPLRTLFIMSSGLMGHSNKIKPGDVLLATESLTNLRRISISLLLGWRPESQTLLGLAEAMEERGGGVWMS